MSDATKLKDEFQSMFNESKYYLNVCENSDYATCLDRIEGNSDYFTKLERYENIPFLNLFYKYKCKKINKDLHSFLCEMHSSLGEQRWKITKKFAESNR